VQLQHLEGILWIRSFLILFADPSVDRTKRPSAQQDAKITKNQSSRGDTGIGVIHHYHWALHGGFGGAALFCGNNPCSLSRAKYSSLFPK
jgi:hypothetical protein